MTGDNGGNLAGEDFVLRVKRGRSHAAVIEIFNQAVQDLSGAAVFRKPGVRALAFQVGEKFKAFFAGAQEPAVEPHGHIAMAGVAFLVFRDQIGDIVHMRSVIAQRNQHIPRRVQVRHGGKIRIQQIFRHIHDQAGAHQRKIKRQRAERIGFFLCLAQRAKQPALSSGQRETENNRERMPIILFLFWKFYV